MCLLHAYIIFEPVLERFLPVWLFTAKWIGFPYFTCLTICRTPFELIDFATVFTVLQFRFLIFTFAFSRWWLPARDCPTFRNSMYWFVFHRMYLLFRNFMCTFTFHKVYSFLQGQFWTFTTTFFEKHLLLGNEQGGVSNHIVLMLLSTIFH